MAGEWYPKKPHTGERWGQKETEKDTHTYSHTHRDRKERERYIDI